MMLVPQGARLGPAARARALERCASETFDLLVIGGGVTGCGIALDAASRGLTVALVEKRDIGAGTSSRSSKLVHGGLRYLEHLDFGLVREALGERRLLLEKIAPHLVKAAPFLLPLRRRVWDRFYLGSGLLLYDALAGLHAAVPRHRHLSRATCLRAVPALRAEAIHGGIRFYDAQMDDARFAVALARTAAAHGAVLAPGVRVTAFLHEGDRITGAHVQDLESDRAFDVRARVVINAAGVWCAEIERMAGVENPLRVRPSKGVHIVVPKDRLESAYALILPTEKSVLFVLPWSDWWIIGTTDTEWDFDLDHPAATRADIQYLLDHVNQALTRPLSRDDVVGVFTGLRPLVIDGDQETATLSRQHKVHCGAPGLVSIAGGKYTTYRIMARDAVDVAIRQLDFAVDASRTEDIPLLGAVGLAGAQAHALTHAACASCTLEHVRHLVTRYGSLASEVLDLVAAEPALGKPLVGAPNYLAAEVRYAASHEAALHVDDTLTRRTHIAFEAKDRGCEAAVIVARLMAPVLGWDDQTIAREVSHYHARVEAERTAESMPDDADADSARRVVRDLRLVSRDSAAEMERRLAR